MSLQVWLPLNDNDQNYGLNCEDSTILNTLSFVTGGMFGNKCLSSGTGSITVPLSPAPSTELSIAFWIKPVSSIADTTVFAFGDNRIDYNGSAFCLKGDLIADGTVLFSVANNTWSHIIIVADGTEVKVIQDGTELTPITQTESVGNIFTPSTISIGAKIDGTSNWSGLIQDVRVYDTALSKKEIIELSKALMLHYKMNHSGFGNQNVLATGITSVTKTTYELRQAFIDFSIYANLDVGTYTISALTDGTWMSEDGNSGSDPTSKSVGLLIYMVDGSYNVTGSSFLDMSTGTVTFTTGTAGRYYFAPVLYSDGSTDVTVSVYNIKVEEGNRTTIYCPPVGTSEFAALGLDITESDVSDNSFDGTMSSTAPTWSSDSEVYIGSYDFSNDSYIESPVLDLTTVTKFTISIWAKSDSFSNKILFGFNGGNRFSFATAGGHFGLYNGSAQNNFDASVSDYEGSWHNYVITGDGTTNKLYIDGEFIGTTSSYLGLGSNKLYISGYDDTSSFKFNGLMNDFRLYATCFTADQVASMYKDRTVIDKNGQLYSLEFIDIGSEKTFMSKNGTFTSPEFTVFDTPINQNSVNFDEADHTYFKSSKTVSVDLFEI